MSTTKKDANLPADITEKKLEKAREKGWTCSHNVAVILGFERVLETQQKMGDEYSDLWGAEVYGKTREAVEGKGGTNTRLLKLVDADTMEVGK